MDRFIHGSKQMKPNDSGVPQTFLLAPPWGFVGNFLTIDMQFDTDIHVPLRMNSNNFGNPLTFHLVPSSGQTFYSSNMWTNTQNIVYDQIPAKLMTFSISLSWMPC